MEEVKFQVKRKPIPSQASHLYGEHAGLVLSPAMIPESFWAVDGATKMTWVGDRRSVADGPMVERLSVWFMFIRRVVVLN